ncbi:MAG: sugar kinase [Chloroflexi bacterium]|nr:sugar kinase [Chloroflexota bacterium]
MYDLVTFGESMIRLTPPEYRRIEQAREFQVGVSGAELNTATGASRLGLKTAWVSRLVDSPPGRLIANSAREQQVDVSNVIWTKEGRVGLYYYEMGASTRASQVLYDRQHSAMSELKPGEIDWEPILRDTRALHVSGITPALSPSCGQAVVEALNAARLAGCSISFDVNYRSRLWSRTEARDYLSGILGLVTILFTTQDEAEAVFGVRDDAEAVARTLAQQFHIPVVAITQREAPTVLRGRWSSLAHCDGCVYRGRVIELELVDRMGSGDAYDAGFLYGYLTGDVQKAIAYGDAMSALKHSVPGDYTWVTPAEVAAQVDNAQTKIQR